MPYIPTFSLRYRHLMKINTHCCECRCSWCLPSNWRTQYTFRVLLFTWCILLDVVLLLLDVCHSVDKHWSNVVCNIHILALHHFFWQYSKNKWKQILYIIFFGWDLYRGTPHSHQVTKGVWWRWWFGPIREYLLDWGSFTQIPQTGIDPFGSSHWRQQNVWLYCLLKGGTYLWEQVRVQVRVQLAVPRIWVFGQEPPGIFWCPQKSRWGRSSVEEATRVIRKEMPQFRVREPLPCVRHLCFFVFLNRFEEIFQFHLYMWSHINETAFRFRDVHSYMFTFRYCCSRTVQLCDS